jgi:hypothetical protein
MKIPLLEEENVLVETSFTFYLNLNGADSLIAYDLNCLKSKRIQQLMYVCWLK